MSLSQAIILGIVQGMTEFLPISSSAHLVILPHFFGWEHPDVAFDVFLHSGTLLSLIIFFRKDILKVFKNFRLLSFIVIGSIPVGIFGVFFKDFFESFFENIKFTGTFLIINSVILFSTKFKKYREKKIEEMNIKDALFIGIFQIFGILPGISRSGITITGGIFRELKDEDSFKFSFLLSIPAISGAALLKFKNLLKLNTCIDFNLTQLLTGIFLAGISGYLALFLLRKVVKIKKLEIFSYYCLLLGIFALL